MSTEESTFFQLQSWRQSDGQEVKVLFPGFNPTCMCCWDDIDRSNFVAYNTVQNASSGSVETKWQACGFCEACVTILLQTQWDLYVNTLAKTTCKAEQRRLLAKGPPTKIHDSKALPVPENAEVELLWYSSDSLEHSSKLQGALEGEARIKYWEDQKMFYIHDEADDAAEEKS